MVKPYIGIPAQQEEVIKQLASCIGLESRTPSGLYIIGGGPMVGKTTVTNKVVGQIVERPFGSFSLCDESRQDMNVDVHTSEIDTIFQRGIADGKKIFTLGEMGPIDVEWPLFLREFYNRNPQVTILFNFLNKNVFPWKTEDIEQSTLQICNRLFEDVPHTVHMLHTDPVRPFEALWEAMEVYRNEGEEWWFNYIAKHLGLALSEKHEEFVELNYLRDRENFIQHLRDFAQRQEYSIWSEEYQARHGKIEGE